MASFRKGRAVSEIGLETLKQCPECSGPSLIQVRAGSQTNFYCPDCVLCWHLESGRATVVDPQMCLGCQLGTTACFERWEALRSW